MNRGLWIKTWREVWLSTLLFGVALFGVEAILAYLLPILYNQFADVWLQAAFIRNIFKALTGADMGDNFGLRTVLSVAWVHPVALALVWAQGIVFCTRMPAGEIDRGTIDVWLGLPVSRWQLYITDSILCLLSGAAILLMALAGALVGYNTLQPAEQPSLASLLVVLVNLWCLYVAVAGLSYVVSSLSDRRGRAVGAVFAVVLASFLLNFIAEFWKPAKELAFLGMLHYYKPLPVLQEGLWPIKDILVLAALGAAFWLFGGIIFQRRDIRTV